MVEVVINSLAVLTIMAQAALALLLILFLLRLAGVAGPWRFLRETLRGSELWLAFVVALVATGGSLFLSEAAHFPPCKLCWFQRIAMYPLVLLVLPAFFRDRNAARYLLPLPVIGLAISSWHVLVERGVVEEAQSCLISAPGGCGVKWVEEFGYLTIPTMAGTAFILIALLLTMALERTRAARRA